MIFVSICLFFVGIVLFAQAVFLKTSIEPSMTMLIISSGFMTGGFMILWSKFVGFPKVDGEITNSSMLNLMLPIFLSMIIFTVSNLLIGNYIYNKTQKS